MGQAEAPAQQLMSTSMLHLSEMEGITEKHCLSSSSYETINADVGIPS